MIDLIFEFLGSLLAEIFVNHKYWWVILCLLALVLIIVICCA